jgi:hypothetical protein
MYNFQGAVLQNPHVVVAEHETVGSLSSRGMKGSFSDACELEVFTRAFQIKITFCHVSEVAEIAFKWNAHKLIPILCGSKLQGFIVFHGHEFLPNSFISEDWKVVIQGLAETWTAPNILAWGEILPFL